MEDNFNSSLKLTRKVIEEYSIYVSNRHDAKQRETIIHPIISNFLFERQNELLEQERLNTIFKLSRSFNDKEMYSIIKQLNYKLNIEVKE